MKLNYVCLKNGVEISRIRFKSASDETLKIWTNAIFEAHGNGDDISFKVEISKE